MGKGPFAGLLLADAGANVLRIDRAIPGKTHTAGVSPPLTGDMLTRHKSSIAVNLKSADGVALIKELSKTADVIIDPFRPGVLEKLGLGPDVLSAINPRIIYGRMTGFRRDGKYAAMAGHDINYLAVSGVLSILGRDGEKPHPPWNILADFAGGGATLFQGILMALIARQRTGKGQVVEANMVDGANYLTTFPRIAHKTPLGQYGRGNNQLDGGCPFYDTYETSDGKYTSVAALEPQFFAVLIKGLGLDKKPYAGSTERFDRGFWSLMKSDFERVFKGKTRAQWEAIFDGTDACCAPVLEYAELENEPGREGDVRPAVTLRSTPMLAVNQNATDATLQGQGKGVSGNGYYGHVLGVGQDGGEALRDWYGLKGYGVEGGGLIWKSKSKL
ncbi:alpha-methylacyl-CoA racemase [Xylariaceae sp. FL0255]|nr:alpha-methylacyl-CoA racemase [Xylariaceae sp. FL0255]